VRSTSCEAFSYVAFRGEIRNAYNILVREPEGMNPLRDLDIDVGVI
jgi:hypothetical protein